MNEFRYSPQKYRVHVSEPERAVRIEKIQQLLTADDSHQGGRGVTVGITRAPGMDEEAEGLAPAFDYTGKGCDMFTPDIGLIALGLYGYALAVHNNIPVDTPITGIPEIMDNLIPFTGEGMQQQLFEHVWVDGPKVQHKLSRSILFLPGIDTIVYLPSTADIPLVPFLPEYEETYDGNQQYHQQGCYVN